MKSNRNGTMGRITVPIEVASNLDLVLADLGMLPHEKVRRVKLSGIVDTGATELVLPASTVAQLGLSPSDRTTVKYGDNCRAERDVVFNVWLGLQGRRRVLNAIVEPDRTEALIGAIPLESMDFLIDCRTNTLYPRDPNTTISEIE
jgi:predicted aspartyl protease